jgi:hypothetical protein
MTTPFEPFLESIPEAATHAFQKSLAIIQRFAAIEDRDFHGYTSFCAMSKDGRETRIAVRIEISTNPPEDQS